MKYYAGNGLLNSAINKLPFELHLPGGYNWCGPGTKVDKRLARNDPGINQLDEACKEHDIFYSKEQNLSQRHEADKVLARKALARFKASDANWKEKVAALGVAGAMKAKVKLGMGLYKTTMGNQISKNIKNIQRELESSLTHTKQIINILNSSNQSSGKSTGSRKTVNNKEKRSNKIWQKKEKNHQNVDDDAADEDDGRKNDYNKVTVRKRKPRENKTQAKTQIRKSPNLKRKLSKQNMKNEDEPMDVDIADDYPLNRIQRKRKNEDVITGTSKIPRKTDDGIIGSKLKRHFVGDSEGSLSKKMKIDINEPLILPNEYNRKRKSNITDESQIPQKVQVVEQV